MRLGAQNRTEVVLLIVLLAVASGLAFRRHSSPEPQAAPAANADQAPKSARGPLINDLDPTLRFDLLRASQSVEYKGSGRNIFKAEPDIPQPIAPAISHPFIGPPPPPPPPPIDLKYYGYSRGAGEPQRVFLSQGDDIFIAKVGDIVDRRYKVDRIQPDSVQVTDLINNHTQDIPLTAAPAGSDGPQ